MAVGVMLYIIPSAHFVSMALMSCLALPITLCGVTLFEGVFSLEVPHILRKKIPDSNVDL
jgi:hypothetical protein